MKLIPCVCAVALIAGAASSWAAAEFPLAAQPQLAATAAGRVWVAFGRDKEILVARSDDAGATFGPPVRVAMLPSLMLGRRRGPRIVAQGDHVTVTAMAGDYFAFHSRDAGATWAGPVRVNDAPRSAREGLHALAVAPDGRCFTVWLDLRGERTQLFSAESTDHGATWSSNRLVYRAPDGHTVCECCHPTALYDARGDLLVMWRNAIAGARDLWSSVRPAGAGEFGPAAKLGHGTWPLKACPMDGGAAFATGEAFSTIWQRDGAVFLARPGQPETRLGPGTQPVAAVTAARSLAVWQQGFDLWSASLDPGATPQRHAAQARFPSLLAVPGTDHLLLAYERGTAVVIERL